MQKYWARKPHNVVADYIERYSEPNEVVLDPFLGSGVTLLEAVRLKRKAIGFDLDPFSILITEATIKGTNLPQLEAEFNSIRTDMQSDIDALYPAICPQCKQHGITKYVVWSYVVSCPVCRKPVLMADARRPKGIRQNMYKCPSCRQEFSYANAEITDEVPILLRMACTKCNKNITIKSPKLIHPSFDLSSTWYPKIRFTYNGNRPFVTRRRANTIEQLYTERNLYALGVLWNRILKIKEENIRRIFQFIFVSMVPQASHLIPYRHGFTTGGPAWTVPEYLILPVHCEFNAWSRFETRFRAIIRGLEDRTIRLPTHLTEAQNFEALAKSDYLLSKVNAVSISSVIPANSIDYVFTDPPMEERFNISN
jgi:uncharacterized protein YbaR (Trm112 family)/16S rRNA G966 N2-methylase RsmD